MKINIASAILLIAGMATISYAQEWGNVATISSTVNNRTCVFNLNADSAEDIDCSATNPYIDQAGNVTVTGVVSATAFYGDGSNLTGVSGVSSLVSLTDVSATSPASGAFLRFDGSSWTAVTGNSAVSTTTMVVNLPDAIKCSNTGYGTRILYLSASPGGDGNYYYLDPVYSDSYNVYSGYTPAGAYYQQGTAMTTSGGCYNKSIATLYEEGNAFNFLGNNGASTSASAVWSVSSTDAFRISGNVGVGTDSPSDTLHVDGSVRISGGSAELCSTADHLGRIVWDSARKKMKLCK